MLEERIYLNVKLFKLLNFISSKYNIEGLMIQIISLLIVFNFNNEMIFTKMRLF
jgi:hypothetical protein